jgi:hypothetical protein
VTTVSDNDAGTPLQQFADGPFDQMLGGGVHEEDSREGEQLRPHCMQEPFKSS